MPPHCFVASRDSALPHCLGPGSLPGTTPLLAPLHDPAPLHRLAPPTPRVTQRGPAPGLPNPVCPTVRHTATMAHSPPTQPFAPSLQTAPEPARTRDPTAGSLVRRHRRGRHPRARHPRARHPRGRQPPARHPRARSPRARGPRTRRPRACHPRTRGPRGRHPGDRPRRRRRQLALARPASPLRPRRRRGQGRRLRVGRRAGRPCPARSRLPPLLRRPAAGGPRHPRQHPWRDAGRARRLAPRRGTRLRRARPHPGAELLRGVGCLGCDRPPPRARAAGAAAYRHRHGPAGPRPARAGGAASRPRPLRRHRPALRHDPPGGVRGPRRPDQRPPARPLRRRLRRAAAGAAQLRQLVRHLPGRRLGLRPRPPRRGAVRHQPDPRPAQPDAPGGAADRPHPGGARPATGRDRRLQRYLARRPPVAHRHHRGGLRRRLAPQPVRTRPGGL